MALEIAAGTENLQELCRRIKVQHWYGFHRDGIGAHVTYLWRLSYGAAIVHISPTSASAMLVDLTADLTYFALHFCPTLSA